jgi:uncharacterized protein
MTETDSDPPAGSPPSALRFPCRFPIKAVGEGGDVLRERVVAIVREHVAVLVEEDIWVKPSRAGRFVSVTVIVDANSQAQLDAIYLALKAEPLVSVLL